MPNQYLIFAAISIAVIVAARIIRRQVTGNLQPAMPPQIDAFNGAYRGLTKTPGLSAAYGEIELTIKDRAAKVRIAEDRDVVEEDLSLAEFRAMSVEEIAQCYGRDGYKAEGLVVGFKPVAAEHPKFFFLYDMPDGTCTHLIVRLGDDGEMLGATRLMSPATVDIGDFEAELGSMRMRRPPCHVTRLKPLVAPWVAVE